MINIIFDFEDSVQRCILRKFYHNVFIHRNSKKVTLYTAIVLGNGDQLSGNSKLSIKFNKDDISDVNTKDITMEFIHQDKALKTVWGQKSVVLIKDNDIVKCYNKLADVKNLSDTKSINEFHYIEPAGSRVALYLDKDKRSHDFKSLVVPAFLCDENKSTSHSDHYYVGINGVSIPKYIESILVVKHTLTLKSIGNDIDYKINFRFNNNPNLDIISPDLALYFILDNQDEISDATETFLEFCEDHQSTGDARNGDNEVDIGKVLYKEKINTVAYLNDWIYKENILVSNVYRLFCADIKNNDTIPDHVTFKLKIINRDKIQLNKLVSTIIITSFVAMGLDETRLQAISSYLPSWLFKAVGWWLVSIAMLTFIHYCKLTFPDTKVYKNRKKAAFWIFIVSNGLWLIWSTYILLLSFKHAFICTILQKQSWLMPTIIFVLFILIAALKKLPLWIRKK